ncbi:ATP phosphoribosyltransferase regulatory subunit, partial [Eubacterium aggregans]|uniref:ATP phosphoribosyltransferase regulatory subunit n=1 Tax=Eubacterium aggregans TaxID=81409 RepID=UPI003F304843
YVNGWGEPVIGGGRYDDLSARFGIDRPACGFAIDILQLMDYMEQNDLLPADTASRTVILYDHGDKCQAFDTAAVLRAQGHSTEVFQVSEAPLTTKAQLQHNQMYEGASFYYISDGKTFQFKADAFKPIACIT